MTDIERYVEKAAEAFKANDYADTTDPAGRAFVIRAVLAAVYADIRRDVGEEIREAIFQAADAVIPSGEYAHGATNGLIQAAIIARTVGTGREEI